METTNRSIETALGLATVRRLARTGEARRIRVAAALTQQEVADAVGVTEAAISTWESGKHRPSGRPALRYGRLLAALARQLGEPTGAQC